MTSTVKKVKTKASWVDVKAKLADFDHAGLIQLDADLYAHRHFNHKYRIARCGFRAQYFCLPTVCALIISAHSLSVNTREREWKALPSDPSSENVPPRPSITSMIS